MSLHAYDSDSGYSTDTPIVVRTRKAIPPSRRNIAASRTNLRYVEDAAGSCLMQPVSDLATSSVDFPPPAFVIKSHVEALFRTSNNRYAPAEGIDSLRRAIADTYAPRYGRELNPSIEILVTAGVVEGLAAAVMTYTQPGDEVILIEPVLQLYVYQVAFAGATVKYVPLRPPKDHHSKTISGNEWTVDFDELERAITPRTKMLILNNPNNPLGKVFSPRELFTIGSLAVRHDLVILSDEVYERVVFESPLHASGPTRHTSIAGLSPEIADNTLTCVSMGKLFNVTGWRLGFMIGPERLIKPVTDSHHALAYSCATPVQAAYAESLHEASASGWWRENAQNIAGRAARIGAVLDEIGLNYVAPAGAWHIFVNIGRLDIPDSFEFPILLQKNTADWKACYFILQKAGISSVPGSSFYGPGNSDIGESYIRFSICKSDESLALAEQRLRKLKPFIRQSIIDLTSCSSVVPGYTELPA